MNNAASTPTGMILDGGTDGREEVLTVLEVARFLRVPKSTVYKLARLGQLPASRIGKHWRFLRRDVRDWLSGQRTSGGRG